MLTLMIFTVLLVLIMINVPIAVAMATDGDHVLRRSGQCIAPDHAAPEDVRLHDRFHPAGDPLLHPGRQPDEHRRRDEPDLPLCQGRGRPRSRRARTGLRHRQRHLLRHVRVGHSGCGGSGPGPAQGDGRQRFQAEILRRHRGLGGDDRSRDPPQHPLCPLRGVDRGIGRQALSGRLHPGGVDGRGHDGRHRAFWPSGTTCPRRNGPICGEVVGEHRKRRFCPCSRPSSSSAAS